jgi:hypothetical protein
MSATEPDDVNDRLTEEVVRLASLRSDDPDEMQDLPPDVAFRIFMEQGRDPDEGGAAITVPAPHKPSPHDSAIALPLPVEDEPE